jgi:hypothetical protein
MNFFRKLSHLWDNVEKYGKVRQATDGNIIRRLRFAFLVSKAAHIHPEYVILITFPRQQWLHLRASLLRYVYIARLVTVSRHTLNCLVVSTVSLSGSCGFPSRPGCRLSRVIISRSSVFSWRCWGRLRPAMTTSFHVLTARAILYYLSHVLKKIPSVKPRTSEWMTDWANHRAGWRSLSFYGVFVRWPKFRPS